MKKIQKEDVLKLAHVRAALDAKVYDLDRMENAVRSWYGQQAKNNTGEASSASWSATKGAKGKLVTTEEWVDAKGCPESYVYTAENAVLALEAKLECVVPSVELTWFQAVVWLEHYKFSSVLPKGGTGKNKPSIKLPASRANGQAEPVKA